MADAVRAANKSAYLTHIDPRDAEFKVEQQHWADELDQHAPASFEFIIVDEPATPDDDPVIDGDLARVTVRMTYRMPVGHATVADGKQATWPAVFRRFDEDGNGPEPARWRYAGEDWISISGEYGAADAGTRGTFVVRHFRGSEQVAQQVIAAFPEAKAHADAEFGINITRPLQIKLYQDMEHLKASVYLSMPDEVLGGWNEPGESIKFMADYARSVERWRGAFAHEYGHVATWELGARAGSMPWWMAEGIAELVAERFMENGEAVHRMMLRYAHEEKLCAWEAIADYDTAEQRVKRMAYHQGHHLMTYVTNKWGKFRRNSWISAVASGRTLDDATFDVFSMKFSDLDAEWRRSLTDGGKSGAKARTPSDEH